MKKRMDYMESEITKMGKYLSDNEQYYQPTTQRQPQRSAQDQRLRYRNTNVRLEDRQPQRYQQTNPPVHDPRVRDPPPTQQYMSPPEPLVSNEQDERLLQQRQKAEQVQQQIEQQIEQPDNREYEQPQNENTISNVMESHVADFKGELCTIDGDCENTLNMALKD